MADTNDLDLANEVGHRLQKHVPALAGDVGPLFSAAAYNLAGARIAATLAASATDGALPAVIDVIGDEQQDLILRAAFDNCLRSTATALDVCAAGLYRLGDGCQNAQQASLGQWWKFGPHCSLPQSLEDWIKDMRNSDGWKALNDARNHVTHSWIEHTVFVGSCLLPVEVTYGDKALSVKDACSDISRLGAEGFRDLVARIAIEYP